MNRFAWRHQYDVESDERAGEAASLLCLDDSLTQQSHAVDADINVLVARFGITDGAIAPALLDPRLFGDFSDVVEFRDSLDRIRDAEARFAALPAQLRNRFGNDPAALWQFVNDESNLEESISLGLLHREAAPVPVPEPPAPVPVPVPPAPPVAG